MASAAKPIPDGYGTITPYLVIRGAEKAIEFYKKAFGAVEISKSPGPGGLLMHAEIRIGNSKVMICDEMPQMEGCVSPTKLGGTTAMLHVYTEDVDSLFDRAVQAGATPRMPVWDTFWGDRYGKLRRDGRPCAHRHPWP